MKLKVSTASAIKTPKKARKKHKGIVYVLEIDLEDKKLIKVGITTRRIEDRVCEILTAVWKKYRIFPQCCVKRFTSFDNPAAIEASIHDKLKEFRYKTLHKFSGSTEFFFLPLADVVTVYDSYTK